MGVAAGHVIMNYTTPYYSNSEPLNWCKYRSAYRYSQVRMRMLWRNPIALTFAPPVGVKNLSFAQATQHIHAQHIQNSTFHKGSSVELGAGYTLAGP